MKSPSFLSNDGAKNIVDEPLALGWTAEPMSANGDTIRTDGVFKYGYAHKYGNGFFTVNGVTFTAFNDENDFNNLSLNPDVSVSPTGFTWTSELGDEGVAGDYGAMLANAFWNTSTGGKYTFTLKNLEPGKTYLVQVVAHWHNRIYTVASIGQSL